MFYTTEYCCALGSPPLDACCDFCSWEDIEGADAYSCSDLLGLLVVSPSSSESTSRFNAVIPAASHSLTIFTVRLLSMSLKRRCIWPSH